MSTLDDLVNRTRTRLRGAVSNDRFNRLDGTITADDDALVVEFTPDRALTAGVILEIDYEQMLVLEVTDNTVAVMRAYNETAAAGHLNDAVITVAPRFPKAQILQALAEEIRQLPRGIYGVDSIDVSFTAGHNIVEIDPGVSEVYRVLRAWRTDGYSYRTVRVDLIRNAGDDFPSGYALAIRDALSYNATTSVRVDVALSLTNATLDSTTDLQNDVGVSMAVEDAVCWLAGSNLLLDKEALRLDATRQGQPRDAAELPADALSKLAARWRDQGTAKVSAEMVRLLELYPWGGA